MVAWYWYILGIVTLFMAAIGIEWVIDFIMTWPFEE